MEYSFEHVDFIDVGYTKNEVWVDLVERVLPHFAPEEIEFVLTEIRAGNIDGGKYFADFASEDCTVCLMGTFLKHKEIVTIDEYNEWAMREYQKGRRLIWHNSYVNELLDKYVANPDSPIETFVAAISPGDTPENSEYCLLLETWMEDYLNV